MAADALPSWLVGVIEAEEESWVEAQATQPWPCTVCASENRPALKQCQQCGMLKTLVSSIDAAPPSSPRSGRPRPASARPAREPVPPMAHAPPGPLDSVADSVVAAATYLHATGFEAYAAMASLRGLTLRELAGLGIGDLAKE